jgi:hypothetical protein
MIISKVANQKLFAMNRKLLIIRENIPTYKVGSYSMAYIQNKVQQSAFMQVRSLNVSVLPSDNVIRVRVKEIETVTSISVISEFKSQFKPFVQALFINNLRVGASSVYATALYNTALVLAFKTALSSAFYLHVQKNNVTLRMPMFMAKMMSVVSVPVETLNIGSTLGCTTRGQVLPDHQLSEIVSVFSSLDPSDLGNLYEDVGLKLSRSQVIKLQSNISRLLNVDDTFELFDNIVSILSSVCTFVGTTPCVSFDAVHRSQSTLSIYKYRNFVDESFIISSRGLSSYSSEVNKDLTFIFLKLYRPVFEYESGSLLSRDTLPSDVIIDLNQSTYFEAYSSLLSMDIETGLGIHVKSNVFSSSNNNSFGKNEVMTRTSGSTSLTGNRGLGSSLNSDTSRRTGQDRSFSLGINCTSIKVRLLRPFNNKVIYSFIS